MRGAATFQVWLLVSVFGQAVAWAMPPVADTLRVAVHLGALRDASKADVEASMTVWADEVMKVIELPAEIRFYDQVPDIRRDIETGRVNFVVADGVNLIRHFAADEFTDGFGAGKASEAQFLLVARQGAGIKSARDLAGKRVMLLADHELSDLLMDTLCRRSLGRDCASAGVAIVKENRSQQLLLKLFFGKADAVLVRGYAYEVAAELNPQIRHRTQVIEKYPLYGAAIGLFSRRVDPAFRDYVIGKVPLVQKHPRGQQILQVMQTERVVRYPKSILDPIRDLMREQTVLVARQDGRRGGR